jgi:hypothetical protein
VRLRRAKDHHHLSAKRAFRSKAVKGPLRRVLTRSVLAVLRSACGFRARP